MSQITYFRGICNSLNVSGKPWLGGKEGVSKWSYMHFPVPGYLLSCRDLLIWRSIPFLVHSCFKPDLLTALITSGKGRLSGSSGTPGQKKKGTDQSKRMPFALHGVSAPFQEVRSWNPTCNTIFSHFLIWFCFERRYWIGAFHSWPLPTRNIWPDGCPQEVH